MKKVVSYFFIVTFIAVIFFPFSVDLPRRHRGGFLSDESTYFALCQSLAYDYDLEYTKEDIVRIKERFWLGPMGVFLKKTDKGIYYGKSFAYPLYAAPFYRVFDTEGLVLFNGLMIWLSMFMGYWFLKQYFNDFKSFIISLAFIACTVIPAYIWWLTADLFNFFIIFTGLFFFFYKFKCKNLQYLSALFLASGVYSKPSALVIAFFIFLIPLFRKEYKKFIILSLIGGVVLGLFTAFNYTQSGELNYQGGYRKSFYKYYPLEKGKAGFDSVSKTSSQVMSADNFWDRFGISPHIFSLNIIYYFFGRFTGMFIYFFPAFLAFFIFFFVKKRFEDWFIFAGICASILVFIVVTSDNYFGGCGSLGNRYFLTIYPLFFFLGFRERSTGMFAVPFIMAAILLPGVYADSFYRSTVVRKTGVGFPVNLFPPEKTQYATLQSNENPRAFGRPVRDSKGNRLWIYFINDNFWTLQDNYFWTYSNKMCEIFVVTPYKVKKMRIDLINSPVKNSAYVDVEGRSRRVGFKKGEHTTLFFKKPNSLRMRERRVPFNTAVLTFFEKFIPYKPGFSGLEHKKIMVPSFRYVYHLKIQSEKSFNSYNITRNPSDNRNLGVRVKVGVDY